jgi:hypothetical protein
MTLAAGGLQAAEMNVAEMERRDLSEAKTRSEMEA